MKYGQVEIAEPISAGQRGDMLVVTRLGLVSAPRWRVRLRQTSERISGQLQEAMAIESTQDWANVYAHAEETRTAWGWTKEQVYERAGISEPVYNGMRTGRPIRRRDRDTHGSPVTELIDSA